MQEICGTVGRGGGCRGNIIRILLMRGGRPLWEDALLH